jgi:hypothetical protein
VFLPSWQAISDVNSQLVQDYALFSKLQVFVLHSLLPMQEQQEAFTHAPPGGLVTMLGCFCMHVVADMSVSWTGCRGCLRLLADRLCICMVHVHWQHQIRSGAVTHASQCELKRFSIRGCACDEVRLRLACQLCRVWRPLYHIIN